jgi:hypothetical protein
MQEENRNNDGGHIFQRKMPNRAISDDVEAIRA